MGKQWKTYKKNLNSNIQLEFARKKRFRSIHSIIACMWYHEIHAESHEINLQFYSLHELQDLSRQKKQIWLPRVAERIHFYKKYIFEMDKEKNELMRAIQGKFSRSILLIGNTGVGKTALIYDLTRVFPNIKIWETTASFLVQKLTNEAGWQQNITQLCKELQGEKDILFVKNLAALFEVGQYIGNNMSIAEYLKESIQRGGIRIISECTFEELAIIENRVPGYSGLFECIQIQTPREEKLEKIIQDKVQILASENQVRVSKEAIQELIKLQQRYTPYSGFPGKSIRFIESIILNEKIDTDTIRQKTIIARFCEETGMPEFMINSEEEMNVEATKRFFQQQVFGQDHAIKNND